MEIKEILSSPEGRCLELKEEFKDIYNEENLRKLGLNERQIKAIMYVKEKGRITNREYRKLNNISDEGARKDIISLIEKQILVAKGSGRGTYYELKKIGN